MPVVCDPDKSVSDFDDQFSDERRNGTSEIEGIYPSAIIVPVYHKKVIGSNGVGVVF